MSPSHVCRVRVTSPSSQSRVRVIWYFIESAQSRRICEMSSRTKLKF